MICFSLNVARQVSREMAHCIERFSAKPFKMMFSIQASVSALSACGLRSIYRPTSGLLRSSNISFTSLTETFRKVSRSVCKTGKGVKLNSIIALKNTGKRALYLMGRLIKGE